jgi:hypothetical protein
MGINVKFTSARNNTDTDFYWTTSDPAVSAKREQVQTIATQMGVQFETTVLEDQLTSLKEYTAESEELWHSFVAAVAESIPDNIYARNSYHTLAGHSLKIKVTDTVTNQVLREADVIV